MNAQRLQLVPRFWAGVHRFTIGQRHGLGIATGRKLYVSHIDARTRRVTVSDARALDTFEAEIGDVWLVSGDVPSLPVSARVQVRHRQYCHQ